MDLMTLNAAKGYADGKLKYSAAACTRKGDYYFDDGALKVYNGSTFDTVQADVPLATTSTAGAVIVGDGLSVSGGTVSVPELTSYDTENTFALLSTNQATITAEITTKVNAAKTELTSKTVPNLISTALSSDTAIEKVITAAGLSTATPSVGVDTEALKTQITNSVLTTVRAEIPTTAQITAIANTQAASAISTMLASSTTMEKIIAATTTSTATFVGAN